MQRFWGATQMLLEVSHLWCQENRDAPETQYLYLAQWVQVTLLPELQLQIYLICKWVYNPYLQSCWQVGVKEKRRWGPANAFFFLSLLAWGWLCSHLSEWWLWTCCLLSGCCLCCYFGLNFWAALPHNWPCLYSSQIKIRSFQIRRWHKGAGGDSEQQNTNDATYIHLLKRLLST